MGEKMKPLDLFGNSGAEDKAEVPQEESVSKGRQKYSLEQLKALAVGESPRTVPVRVTIETEFAPPKNPKDLWMDNDIVFGNLMMREDIALPLLSEIIGRTIVKIISVDEQKVFSGLTPDVDVTTVQLDVLMVVEDQYQQDIIADIELQRYKQGNYFRRIRMYSAEMDHRLEYRKGDKKYNLHDQYMISFMSREVLSELTESAEYPAYQICRMKNQMNQVINNGVTWVMVNYDRLEDLVKEEAPPTVIAIARQFKRVTPDTKYGERLTIATREFLQNEERRQSAMTFGEKLDLARNAGREEGREEEREETLGNMTRMVKKLLEAGTSWELITAIIRETFPNVDISKLQV